MAKIKIHHTVVAVVEVDTEWYPEEIQSDMNKIAEWERDNGDAGILLDFIQEHKVKVIK